MRRVYQVFGALLFALYGIVEVAGYELPGKTTRGAIPPGARNVGGYRTYHFFSGGK